MPYSDPGELELTRNTRWLAREADWVPYFTNQTTAQKKDYLFTVFQDWYKSLATAKQERLKAKIRVLMGDPEATLAEMKDFVYARLNLQNLSEVVEWLS